LGLYHRPRPGIRKAPLSAEQKFINALEGERRENENACKDWSVNNHP